MKKKKTFQRNTILIVTGHDPLMQLVGLQAAYGRLYPQRLHGIGAVFL